ncbi:glycosyltransferase [Microcella daejeonensis]|uniref:Glycosyltransferase n=1 Tax=Microcella daejeonensis TaxID=2994971 RepID=A0A9E8S9D0_9MICO|nr:glycosyltransferase [Microcella daejeonensis]WAB81874.1 glycosyltransferase [Microcella daejeonensis]
MTLDGIHIGAEPTGGLYVHEISVVIPVYQGEKTLATVLEELEPYTVGFMTPGRRQARVGEVILVHDHGPDRSAETLRTLSDRYPHAKTVWLSRNFGQHAATLAGIASSGGAWIVTLDEDGQHDPSYIAAMLDTALDEQASVVYAKAINPPPHGAIRNTASRASKAILQKVFGGGQARDFNSFRLIIGDVGRSIAAYSGTGVYLDVALTWVANRIVTCPVLLREEGGRRSGYSYAKLFAHFWRMILSTGTKGLRLVTLLGVLFAAGGIVFALFLTVVRLGSGDVPEGWTSQMIVTALGTGAILVSLGIVAEYLGVAVNMAMGKPPYLIVRDLHLGPLGKAHERG